MAPVHVGLLVNMMEVVYDEYPGVGLPLAFLEVLDVTGLFLTVVFSAKRLMIAPFQNFSPAMRSPPPTWPGAAV